jgi:hypothetical protein
LPQILLSFKFKKGDYIEFKILNSLKEI